MAQRRESKDTGTDDRLNGARSASRDSDTKALRRVTIGRRSFLYGGAAVAAGMVATTLTSATASARLLHTKATEPESLGVPLREVNLRTAAIGQWVDDSLVTYTYSNGAMGVFSVLDAETGQRLRAHNVTDNNSFDLAVSSDKTVYISTHGDGLFRYFPERDEIVHLGRPGGEPVVLDTIADDNGVLYGGTYPNAHAFKYDPATGAFFDYGQIADGESYLRNVAYDGDGTLYASTRPNGLLFALDVETGSSREIPLPDSAIAATNLRPVFIRQFGLLFVRVSPGLDWHVYDPKADAWVDHTENGGQSGMTEPVRTNTYFLDNTTKNLFEYDLLTRAAAPTSWDSGQLSSTSTQGMGVGVLTGRNSRNYPGKSVVGVGRTGRIWHFNPHTSAHRFVSGEPLGSPVGLHKIGLGPDGNMYIGGYLTTGLMARYLTAEGTFEELRGPQQVSGFANHQGKLYISTYPHHNVMEFDPSGDWDYGSNPRTVFDLGEGQDRARPLEPIGDRLAVGSQADSRQGFLDGQLIFYDPVSGEVDRKGAVKAGHGIASLAYNGSILVGGTTINHLAAPPQDPSAVLFIWDLQADQVAWMSPVLPEAAVICGLTFANTGHLWGLASTGTVFEFDVETRELLRSVQAVESANGASSLFFGPDGKLYGSTAGTFADGVVFSVDVDTLASTTIGSGSFAAPGDRGQIYYTDRDELLRFTP